MASVRIARRLGDAPRRGGPSLSRISTDESEGLSLKPTARGRPPHSSVLRRLVLPAVLCAAPLAAGAQLPGTSATSLLSAFDSAKAESLLRERVPCLGCHVIGGKGGRSAPDLTHVALRRSAAYIRAIVTAPSSVVPATTMPRVPMPASVRELLIAYLSAGAQTGAPVVTPARVPDNSTRNGATLYARNCVACHGERGGGDGPNARYLPVRPVVHADPIVMSTRSDDRLFDAVHGGGYPLGRSAMMPAFGETLTRPEIWLLVRHMRTLCGCAGPAWSRTAPAPSNGSALPSR